jgi:hypothetical protein
MNVFERALRAETYSNALKDPGTAVKNIASDPAFGLVAGLALGPAGYGLTSLNAALAAGGISALATGSLQKGLMTGMSAYGGAGLSDSFMKAGASDIAANAVHEGAIGGQTAGFGNQALQYPSLANASALDKISAGFGAATSSSDAALKFAKDNYGKALMATGPILADQMVSTKTPLPTAGSLTGPSYIRPYSMTRKVRQPEKDIGSREQDWFETTWERGAPYKAANGGIVALAGGGMTSQDAYDFLMGKKSDTGSMVNTVTQAPTYEGRYELDPATGKTRYVPARTPMIAAVKPVIDSTTTPTTDTTGIATLVPNTGNPNAAANQAAAFDAMTPAQKADHQAVMANLSDAMTPLAVKVLQQIKQKILFKNPNEPLAEVVNMDTLSPAVSGVGMGGDGGDGPSGSVTVGPIGPATGDASAPGGVGDGPGGDGGMGGDGGVGGMGGIGGLGIGASPGAAAAMGTGPSGMAANASTAATGTSSGLSGLGVGGGGGASAGVGASPGAAAGMGHGPGGISAGVSSGSSSGGAGGGGGGGGGGGCCFIMLEARYGDGTMDRVVRRYRDEKVTERNKRGYYKLAEVLIPLMRKSKLFSFFVVKTFADPAVCYAKWYYGENKWGWIFKPLERFWMGLFDTLGTDTQFIRENGEVV